MSGFGIGKSLDRLGDLEIWRSGDARSPIMRCVLELERHSAGALRSLEATEFRISKAN